MTINSKLKRMFRNQELRSHTRAMAGCQKIVFDQNLITFLAKNPVFETNLTKELKSRGLKGFYPHLSLFGLLELAGFNQLPKIGVEVPGLENVDNYEEAQMLVFTFFLELCRHLKSLEPRELKCNIEERSKYSKTKTGKRIYEHAKALIHRNRFELKEDLAHAIAVDRMTAYDYPSKFRQSMMNSLPRDLLNLVGAGVPFNLVRLMGPLINEMRRAQKNKGNHEKSKSLAAHWDCMDLRSSKKDLLDTSIVHFVTIGIIQSNKHYRAQVFTCDPSNVVKARLVAYKETYDRFYELLRSKKKEVNYPIRKAKPGVIHFCDSDTGKVMETIDLRRVHSF